MDLELINVLWKDYGIPLKWIPTGTDGDISPESDSACHGSSPYLSLRRVEAVSVSVRNLGIEVVRKPDISRLWRRVEESKADDEERASRKTKILDDVSADIPAGQIMAIIGSSGCGKVRGSRSDGRVR
jgi:ABC-type multidrug transport system fused ATPase/permease subunit